jgi:predicted small secreted protein
MRHLKRWIVAGGLILALWACWGCGTIQGIGRDMQEIGRWMEGSGP